MPPTQADLETLAERALAFLDGDGQATAWWDFRAQRFHGRAVLSEHTQVAFAAAGGGEVVTDRVDDEGLRSAAAAAAALTGPDDGPLPDPEPGRGHDAYDPSAVVSAAAAAAPLPFNGQWQSGAAKVAIASTRGVRAYEQRSFAALQILGLAGRDLWASAAATGPGGLDNEGLMRDLLEFAGEARGEAAVEPGEYPVVLGPWAVASLLDRAAWRFGTGAAESRRPKLGTRIAASAINLSDSPRFARTLPRSYDTKGAPVKPTPLIQDGVAHRLVETRPRASGLVGPANLVLVGGGAASVAELAQPIENGLVITSIHPNGRALGVRRIVGGRFGEAVTDLELSADAFDVLATTEALSSRQWLVPSLGIDSARTAAAVVTPALRVSRLKVG